MTNDFDFRCVLMGDILFRSATAVGISLTVAGPTTYSWTLTLDSGTWFSSGLSFLQWMVQSWNSSIPGGQMSVTLVTDPLDSNYGKYAFVPETGLGTVNEFKIQAPGVFSDLGLSSADHDLGSDTLTKYSGAIPVVLSPYWPPSAYSRGVDNLTGYSGQAHSGKVYSVAGLAQSKVTLGLALDRSSSFDESKAYMRLLRDRWSRGRAVTLYLDASNLPTSWSSTVSNAEVLELPSNDQRANFSRMMENRELINYTEPTTFVRRMPRAGELETYNQAVAPAAEASRVTSFYRVVANEALTSSGFAGMPDDESNVLVFWFRVRATTGPIVEDSGWGNAVIAGGATDGGLGTFSIDNGGDELSYFPRLNNWTLMILTNAGGEIDYLVDGVQSNVPAFNGTSTGNLTFGDAAAGIIELDVANIAMFDTSTQPEYGFTSAEKASLLDAGVKHDYALPWGNWTGRDPVIYWCGTPSSVVANEGSGGTHNLTWTGSADFGAL